MCIPVRPGYGVGKALGGCIRTPGVWVTAAPPPAFLMVHHAQPGPYQYPVHPGDRQTAGGGANAHISQPAEIAVTAFSVLRTRVVELTVRPTCTVTVSSPPPPASAVPPELSRVLTPLHRTQNDTPVAVIRTASLPFRCRRRRAGPREPAAAGPAPRVGRWTVRRLWPRKRTAGTARIGHRHGVLAVELLRKQG